LLPRKPKEQDFAKAYIFKKTQRRYKEDTKKMQNTNPMHQEPPQNHPRNTLRFAKILKRVESCVDG